MDGGNDYKMEHGSDYATLDYSREKAEPESQSGGQTEIITSREEIMTSMEEIDTSKGGASYFLESRGSKESGGQDSNGDYYNNEKGNEGEDYTGLDKDDDTVLEGEDYTGLEEGDDTVLEGEDYTGLKEGGDCSQFGKDCQVS